MPKIFTTLDKIKPAYDITYKVVLFICKLLLILDILITTMSVIGRYVPFIPDPAWSEEVVLTCMSYMAVLSAALAIRRGAHIRMTAFDVYLPKTVVKALDALERKCGAKRFRVIFKSITFDNGSEFSAAEELERSAVNKTIPRTKVYFCHPYSSWERGSNENANIMIRRKHPKGTDFEKVSARQIAETEQWINNYPRKILGYISSEVAFRACLREIGLSA